MDIYLYIYICKKREISKKKRDKRREIDVEKKEMSGEKKRHIYYI